MRRGDRDEAARRRLRGRGPRRLRRHRRHRGVQGHGAGRPSAAATSRSTSAAPREQARTSINGGCSTRRRRSGVALKILIDPRSPFTSGVYRDIDIVVPPGSIVSADATGRPDLPVLGGVDGGAAVRSSARWTTPLGANAIGGDYGSLSHPQRARGAARRHALGHGGAVRRRARPVGCHQGGRRRQLRGVLRGQQPGPGDGGHRVRPADRGAPQGVRRPTARARATTGAGRRCCGTACS